MSTWPENFDCLLRGSCVNSSHIFLPYIFLVFIILFKTSLNLPICFSFFMTYCLWFCVISKSSCCVKCSELSCVKIVSYKKKQTCLAVLLKIKACHISNIIAMQVYLFWDLLEGLFAVFYSELVIYLRLKRGATRPHQHVARE